jgi:NADH dehydrogenase
MKLLVTGANGYIGQRLVRLATMQRHQVVTASRRPLAAMDWLPFDLDQAEDFALPAGVDVLVHLAAVTAPNGDPDGQVQLKAAQALLAACSATGTRLLFVSSQTARQDAPTSYGRTKWQIEQHVLAAGGWVVRPGQVYGAAPAGLFGVLRALVAKLPCLPAFLPAPRIQPIHVDDLAQGMLTLAGGSVPSGIYHLAAAEPVSFTRFLGAIARHRLRRRRVPLPVPVIAVRLAGVLLGARLQQVLGLDRLESLFALATVDAAPDLQRLQLRLRPLEAGMHPSGHERRRKLLLEARALLGYLLAARPAPGLARRYVRAMEQVRDGQPLPLPAWLARYPSAVALWDRCGATGRHGAELGWRLQAATALAEASVQGAARFLGLGRASGLLVACRAIGVAVLGEIFWRCAGLLGGAAVRRSLRQGDAVEH